jgi:hypothetical protein
MACQPGRYNSCVISCQDVEGSEELGKVREGSMLPITPLAVNHHQPRAIPGHDRVLSDQLLGEIEVEIRSEHVLDVSAIQLVAKGSAKRAIKRRNSRIIAVEEIRSQKCEAVSGRPAPAFSSW